MKKENNFGWGILGFFVPIVGLVLFIIWLNKKKDTAKALGIGALIGTILSIILCVVIVFLVWLGIFSGLRTLTQKVYEEELRKDNPTLKEPVCKFYLNKLSSGEDMDINYGHTIYLAGQCDEYPVYDGNGDKLFELEANIEMGKSITYTIIIDGDKIDIIGLNNYSYGANGLEFDSKVFKYYVVDNIVLFDLNYSDPSARKIYTYNVDTKKLVDLSYEVLTTYKSLSSNSDLPRCITSLEIDRSKNIVVKASIHEASGFEGVRDDPRVKVLNEIRSMSSTSFDGTLQKYGVSNFAFEEKYVFDRKYNTPTVSVSRTIEDYYNLIYKDHNE